jgi:hypothetical protein
VDRGRRVVGADRAAAAALAGTGTRASPGGRPAVPAGHPERPLQRHQLATSAAGAGVRLRTDLLARRLGRWHEVGVFEKLHRLLLPKLHAAGELDWSRACVDASHIRAKKGGEATGPSPVDCGKTGSRHHLICDGNGTPFKVITTAANVNDVTQTLALVDGIPPIAGKPGRLRRRPDRPARRQGIRQQPQPARTAQAPYPAGYLPQGLAPHQGPGQASLRGRADLLAAAPLQTPGCPLGETPRPARRPRLTRLRSHLLETPQEGPHMSACELIADLNWVAGRSPRRLVAVRVGRRRTRSRFLPGRGRWPCARRWGRSRVSWAPVPDQ